MLSIMEVKTITLNGIKFTGIKVDFENAPLLIIKANRGFLACGYIDVKTCNKLSDVAAIVRGVNSFESMLQSDVVDLSQKAKEMFQMPIKGKDFLLKISNGDI